MLRYWDIRKYMQHKLNESAVAVLHASVIPSCTLIRSRSTNITRVHVIYRAGWRRRPPGARRPLHIYDIVSRSGETYYYSVINQAFLRRGLSAGSVRCPLLVWHPEQTPRRVIDARIWYMRRHAASTSLLAAS